MMRVRIFIALLTVGTALAWAAASSASDFSAADVYRDASPSVVLILGFNREGKGNIGTGSILSREGLILTNGHVVLDPQAQAPYAEVKVYFKPERITGESRQDLRGAQTAQLLAFDQALDLALIRVNRIPQSARPTVFGDSESTVVGSPVAAIGHPAGGGLWTLTTGTISSVRRDGRRDVFQTDAAINPGNSGGPLLDAGANLIGINTFVRRVNAKGLPLEGLNYSLRGASVRKWLAKQGVEIQVAGPRPVVAAVPARPDTRLELSPPAITPPSASPREFKGEGGQLLFGVPDRSFDLEGTKDEVISRLEQNAKSAFDELDAAGDDDFFGNDEF